MDNKTFLIYIIWILLAGTLTAFTLYKQTGIGMLKLVGIGLGGAFANAYAIYFVMKDTLATSTEIGNVTLPKEPDYGKI